MTEDSLGMRNFHFVCDRCSRTVNPGDEMVTMTVSIETASENGPQGIGHVILACLCLHCGASIIADALLGNSPSAGILYSRHRESNPESRPVSRSEMEVLINLPSEKSNYAILSGVCTDDGLKVKMRCSDATPEFSSQLFTWKEIVQLLLNAHSNMFTSNPNLEKVCIDNLKRLGYDVGE